VDFGVIGVDVASIFEMTDAEHAVFDGRDAVNAPLIVGDGLSELALDRRLRVQAVDDFFGECIVGVHVLGREHDDARGESVAECVHAGAGTALRRSWTVGFLRVESVGCVL
jgi:hypothetical protein